MTPERPDTEHVYYCQTCGKTRMVEWLHRNCPPDRFDRTPDERRAAAAPVTDAGLREALPIIVARWDAGEIDDFGMAEMIVAAAAPVTDAGLRAAERFAANAILDQPNADPDDDAAIVARAALRLDAALSRQADAWAATARQ